MRAVLPATARDAATVTRLVGAVKERVEGMPGVRSAAATWTGLPLKGGSFLNVTLLDAPGQPTFIAGWHAVSPAYFDALAIPLTRGRVFSMRDDPAAPLVAIVNEAMVRRLGPLDPFRVRLRIGAAAGDQLEEHAARTIVGIVGDVRFEGVDHPARPSVYVPMAQLPIGQVTFLSRLLGYVTWLVRLHPAAESMGRQVPDTVRDVTASPVTHVETMGAIAGRALAPAKARMVLLLALAAITIWLAATGVYALVAYAVTQRTRDIAIRVALGAQRRTVWRETAVPAIRASGIGLFIGTLGIIAISRALRAFVFFGFVGEYAPVIPGRRIIRQRELHDRELDVSSHRRRERPQLSVTENVGSYCVLALELADGAQHVKLKSPGRTPTIGRANA
jgi:hypothetical protein